MRSWFSKLPRKVLWIGLAVIIVLAAAGGGFAYYRSTQQQASISSTEPALQTAVVRQGELVLLASGTGTVIPASQLTIGFENSSQLIDILVKVGDKVEGGQLLAQVDDSSLQTQLDQANRSLRELTSPAAMANAQLAVIQAQQNLIIAKTARNKLNYSVDEATVTNVEASYILAQANFENAQESYNRVADLPVDDPRRAQAYQALYNAKASRDNAFNLWDYYNGYKASQTEIDLADANLALAEANLTEAQNYLTALTGGDVAEDATGSSLSQLLQTRANIQTAQDNLDGTRLYAPFAGTIMAINSQVGESAGAGFITIADLSQPYLEIYLDAGDWDKVVVGYEAEVTFDAYPDLVFTGHVVQVEPQLINTQNTLVVKGLVQLDGISETSLIKLPVGLSAAVDVIGGRAENALLIPIDALHSTSSGAYSVFVLENGTPKLRMVEVGLKDIYYVEIKSGLQVGDVVTTGIMETK